MSTIIQIEKANGTHKANGVHPAKKAGPVTVHAIVPPAEPALTAADLWCQEHPSPCTERDALAVTFGTPKMDERTISALIADWAPEAPGEVAETQINIEVDGMVTACDPEQARTAATRLHQLADHIQALAAKVEVPEAPEKKRPSWLTEPCPPWCTDSHEETDFYADRHHSYTGDGMVLSMVQCVGMTDGKGWSHPAEMAVSAEQHYRDAEPTVTLMAPVIDIDDEYRMSASEPTYVKLTMAEARELRDRLSQMLAKLDGSAA